MKTFRFTPSSMRACLIGLVCVIALGTALNAQERSVLAAREFRVANEQRVLGDFLNFLSIPNVASDTANVGRNAEFLLGKMSRVGLNPRLLTLADKTVPPAVYGEWIAPGAKQTIIFY